MKTSQTLPEGNRPCAGLAAGMALATLALCACQASAQGEAKLSTGQDAQQRIRDFDRPLEPADAKAEPVPEAAPPQYALLGARHDLNYVGPTTPVCQCLAVTLSESATDAAFQWEMGAPQLNPSTQQVIAFTSNGVSCDAPPSGTLGASYQGYVVEGNDVVVFVEALGEGRPMTSGAIIPRPQGNGSVMIEPAGAVYGKPLEGKGKRCKLTPSPAAPGASVFGVPPDKTDAAKGGEAKTEGPNPKAESASKP